MGDPWRKVPRRPNAGPGGRRRWCGTPPLDLEVRILAVPVVAVVVPLLVLVVVVVLLLGQLVRVGLVVVAPILGLGLLVAEAHEALDVPSLVRDGLLPDLATAVREVCVELDARADLGVLADGLAVVQRVDLGVGLEGAVVVA